LTPFEQHEETIMAQQGQGQGQGQGNDGDNQGQGKGQEYVVSAEFTDEQGRKWQAGTVFTGNEQAVKKALAAGKIAARPKPAPTA
jgi:hypothetical protein